VDEAVPGQADTTMVSYFDLDLDRAPDEEGRRRKAVVSQTKRRDEAENPRWPVPGTRVKAENPVRKEGERGGGGKNLLDATRRPLNG